MSESWSKLTAPLVGAGLMSLFAGWMLQKGSTMTKMEKTAFAFAELLCAKLIALEDECEKLRARPTQEDYTRLVKENGELSKKNRELQEQLDERTIVSVPVQRGKTAAK